MLAKVGGLVDEGLQCMVCGWGRGGGFTISQLHSVPRWQKEGEGIREGPPLAGSKPKDVCSAGLRVCVCVCDAKALSHTHTYTQTGRGSGEAYSGHTQPPPTLSVLKSCLF